MKLVWDTQRTKDKIDGKLQRDRSADPYHSSRWTKLSRVWREQHPLCEECKRKGVVRAAEVVDHIKPWPICEDFYDTTNLQSLCSECNILKGIKDRPAIQRWKADHEGRGV